MAKTRPFLHHPIQNMVYIAEMKRISFQKILRKVEMHLSKVKNTENILITYWKKTEKLCLLN